jgi:methylthioribose-1-phosphate isomerase
VGARCTLIGAVAAYGLALQASKDPGDAALANTARLLHQSAADGRQPGLGAAAHAARAQAVPLDRRAQAAWDEADAIAEEDVRVNAAIGRAWTAAAAAAAQRRAEAGKTGPLNVLTHCNAGWLATVDWGTATSAIYKAHAAGMPVHVWVDETRPRNQGASLTAWELGQAGVPHTVIADNAGGHLMQHGQVDLCIVGCDRVAANGDVCNKIGTYLKALAAHDNGVPFYVAMPTSTLDLDLADGVRDIPIEERSGRELTHVSGRAASGDRVEVQLTPDGSPAGNPAFDVTPARLITGLITEHGVVSGRKQPPCAS